MNKVSPTFKALFGYSLCSGSNCKLLSNREIIKRIHVCKRTPDVFDKVEKIILAYTYGSIINKYCTYDSFTSNVDDFLKGYRADFEMKFSLDEEYENLVQEEN